MRHLRRVLKSVWWMVTGQFNRLARVLLRYYQRHESSHVKDIVPARMCQAVGRWLLKELKGTRARAMAQQAEAAVAAVGRYNASIERRLSNIDDYKRQVAAYTETRCTGTSQPKDHKIVIYTAISRNYDSIKLPEKPDARFEYVLFTDKPVPDTGVWQVRSITYFHEDPARTARFVKTHPHMLLGEYDVAIWVDANIMIIGDGYPLVEDFLASGKAVAAVPHPVRKSIYQEVEACINRKKEEPEAMREQSARYRALGFDHEDLIESNLMFFDLRDDHVKSLLDTWWTEIDRYSKRDQLSLNYALAQHGLDWYPLTERPNSVRNHPVFALVPHEIRGDPEDRLVDALQVPLVDPYVGPSYADVRDERIGAQQSCSMDIVVCVNNALAQSKLCLDSICRARNSERQRLIIVDDGSDRNTAGYLEEFAGGEPWVELHRNDQARGCTKAANQGLAASTGDLVILLDSDSIVTDGWAEKMADAVFSTPGAGVVGPVSNEASHLSIPEHGSFRDQGAHLLPGLTPEDMNRFCEEWTAAHVLPRVSLVHGFCLGMTRQAIDKVGLFDEEGFPKGYGEETDYCLRAVDAGFSLVIATHTFVFCTKSTNRDDPERVALTKAGSEVLARLHGRARVRRAVTSMQENPILVDLRRQVLDLCLPGPPCGPQFSPVLRQAHTRITGIGTIWKWRRKS